MITLFYHFFHEMARRDNIKVKLPNGFGNVSKLPGERRKPWRARKTTGWDLDYEGGTAKQTYHTVGYYATRQQAIQALAEYNTSPYHLDNDITFQALYEKWSEDKFPTISHSNVNGYKASYAVCSHLDRMKFVDIRKSHLQGVIDNSGKNYPTLKKVKSLYSQLFKCALENDICQKDYSVFVDIAKHKDKMGVGIHKPFLDAEIQLLWDNVSRHEYIQVLLILIYSGVRISELLDLKKEDVRLEDHYFEVLSSKTEAGIRKVPIADKIRPFFEHWMNKGTGDYLLCSVEGQHLKYFNFRDVYWKALMKELSLDHLPHDTRHTTISLLAKANVNQTIIKRIVGHAGAMSLTEKVYTHFEIKQLLDAVNLI